MDWFCSSMTSMLLQSVWDSLSYLRGRSGFLEIVFVGECEVLVCL